MGVIELFVAGAWLLALISTFLAGYEFGYRGHADYQDRRIPELLKKWAGERAEIVVVPDEPESNN